jgi:uncharacterized membrane protein YkvI
MCIVPATIPWIDIQRNIHYPVHMGKIVIMLLRVKLSMLHRLTAVTTKGINYVLRVGD